MKTFSQITEILKTIKHLRTDKQLATILGINYRTFATAKRRDSIPFDVLIPFAAKEGISLDQLLIKTGGSEDRTIVEYSKTRDVLGPYTINEAEQVGVLIQKVRDIMHSDEPGLKLALAQNVDQFHQAVEDRKKLKGYERPRKAADPSTKSSSEAGGK